MLLRFLTAGESHGRAILAILEGVPSGLPLIAEDIDEQLRRRQKGFGRGGRMRLERDKIEFFSGIRDGETLGSPIGMMVRNRDWENWQGIMNPEPLSEVGEADDQKKITRARPGHSDLAGALKYGHEDMRNVLERASARETAMRVAVGAICRKLLATFDIQIVGHVIQIGDAWLNSQELTARLSPDEIRERSEASEVRCADPEAEERMIETIKNAARESDSLGGVLEVMVFNPPVGLGSHVHWDRKLDGRLAGSVMAIQAIKGVEIGIGFEAAGLRGSQVHDEIFYSEEKGFYRKTNRLGGTEGGMSNGEPLTVRAAMKPIPTLGKPLQSVDMATKEAFEAARERTDICSVPAASVVAEGVVAFVVAQAFLEKFGGDSMEEVQRNYEGYVEQMRGM